MNIFLTVFFVLSVLFTIVTLIKGNYTVKNQVAVLKEIPITYLFGILLWAEAILILYIMWVYPDKWLISTNTYINTFIFVILGSALGSYSFLFGLIKKTIATDNELISVSPFGKINRIKWKSIKDIEKPAKNRLKFISSDTEVLVYGPKKSYINFIESIEPMLGSKLKSKFH